MLTRDVFDDAPALALLRALLRGGLADNGSGVLAVIARLEREGCA